MPRQIAGLQLACFGQVFSAFPGCASTTILAAKVVRGALLALPSKEHVLGSSLAVDRPLEDGLQTARGWPGAYLCKPKHGAFLGVYVIGIVNIVSVLSILRCHQGAGVHDVFFYCSLCTHSVFGRAWRHPSGLPGNVLLFYVSRQSDGFVCCRGFEDLPIVHLDITGILGACGAVVSGNCTGRSPVQFV